MGSLNITNKLNVKFKWWNTGGKSPIIVYTPKGASSLADSYKNRVTPGVLDAIPDIAPTWDATNGWTMSGSNDLHSTSYTITQNLSFLIRYSNYSPTASFEYLTGTSTGKVSLRVIGTGFTRVWGYINGSSFGDTHDYLSGVLAITGTPTAYYNGSPLQTGSVPSSFSESANYYIGSYGGSGTNRFIGYIQAVAIYTVNLTDNDILTVSTNMLNL